MLPGLFLPGGLLGLHLPQFSGHWCCNLPQQPAFVPYPLVTQGFSFHIQQCCWSYSFNIQPFQRSFWFQLGHPSTDLTLYTKIASVGADTASQHQRLWLKTVIWRKRHWSLMCAVFIHWWCCFSRSNWWLAVLMKTPLETVCKIHSQNLDFKGTLG